MASAFKDYEAKGIIVKSSFGKVDTTSELTKQGDFVVKAKTDGKIKGVEYNVNAKSMNLSNVDLSTELGYDHKFKVQKTDITVGTKVNIEYDDIQDIDFKHMCPTKFSVSGTVKTDISTSSLTFQPGKDKKLVFANKIGYKLGSVDVVLQFPKIDFFDRKDVKELAEEAEINVSTSLDKLKVGLKADNLGKSLQFFAEDKFGFFRGKTTVKAEIPKKTVKSAFERELVVCKNLSLATRFSFNNCESVKREYGVVFKNDNGNLVVRGLVSNKGDKCVALEHEVSKNVKLHMVGTIHEVEGRKAEEEEARAFSVGITFDA